MKSYLRTIGVSLLVAVLVLGLAEVLLRVLDPASATTLVSVVRLGDRDWYQINRGYLKKYFPAQTPIVPELKPTIFPIEKDRKLFRIICLGESSMFGTPYQMTCTIPAIVRRQLRHLFPDRETEVINLAASAINSNVVVDLTRSIAEYKPDLVLLYLGHNEFYGPDGVGAPLLQRHVTPAIQWAYGLRNLRIVSYVIGMLPRPSTAVDAESEHNLMKQVSAGSRVELHSPEAERIFELFRANLTEILATLRSDGIPVIASDVTSNLDFPPFEYPSDERAGGTPALAADCASKFRAGSYVALLENTSALLKRDSTNALAHYWLGKADIAMGNTAEGKSHLLKAKDYDLLKFRAPERTNAVIHEICANTSTPLISPNALFSSLIRSGTTYEQLFWEHLHPTPLGYYHIADLFVREILRLNLLSPPGAAPAEARLLPFAMDTLGICWLELAYGDLSIQRLTGSWPFNNYKRTPLVLGTASDELKRIAMETYSRKILWEEGCYQSAEFFWKHNDLRSAQTTYDALVEDYPENYYAQYLFGNILVKQGDVQGGVTHYRKAIQTNPRYPNPRLDLALIDINMGKFDDAIGELTSALAVIPDQHTTGIRSNMYYGLAAAYANKQEFDAALKNVQEALLLVPDYPDAVALRNAIVAQQSKAPQP